jgi:hypothetical protein
MDIQQKFQDLQNDLSALKPLMRRTIEVIYEQDVSNYPIFVVHQNLLDVGIAIVQKEANKSKWSVNISTLEEFAARQLIETEKIDDFRTLYKAHRNEFCLFVLSDMGATFIFLPE